MEDICSRAIRVWGTEAQIKTAIGEMAELIDALIKFDRGQITTTDSVVDEIADVMIMCKQLAKIFGESEVMFREEYKLQKITKRLNNIEEKQEYELEKQGDGNCNCHKIKIQDVMSSCTEEEYEELTGIPCYKRK